jgi:CheY-like chemotaxis protein/uncharacterized coiled-coil protein SlyX
MSELISSIAQLLWPLIALSALLVFRHAIGRVLRTFERRELEFEVGGQKLTMRELNDQQNEMIQDLQRQLSVVSKELEARDRAAHVPVPHTPPPPAGSGDAEWAVPNGEVELPDVNAPSGSEPFAVLWVAERPETHALLVQQLRDNGVRVTMVATTIEALAEVAERAYRLIVSDMSRKEDGHYRMDAGLALLRELRDLGVDIPVVVFCSPRGQQQYGAQARQLGAVATTASAYEMFKYFQNFELL